MSLADGELVSQTRARRLQGSIPANYTVFKVGSTVYAESCVPGGTDYSGTNVQTIIQNAIDALTSGRAADEKVVIKGDMTVPGKIYVPSHTIIDIQGTLTLADNVNDNMFQNFKDLVGNTRTEQVTFIHGRLEGNRANQTTGSLIYLDDVMGCQISDITLRNAKQAGAWIRDCWGFGWLIDRCQIQMGSPGIYMYNCNGINITNSGFDSNTTAGLDIAGGVIRIAGNTVENGSADGIILRANSFNNLLENNYIESNAGYGVQMVGTAGSKIRNTVLQGNHINLNRTDNASDLNVRIEHAYNTKIRDNYFLNCTTSISNTATSDSLRLLGNHPLDTNFISDAGTNTWFPSVIAPFVDGTACEDSGWDIDAVGEYARAFAILPSDLIKIHQIKIYGRSMVLEADAMRLEIIMNGGADNEAYNTEAISIVDKASTSTNFAADDIVYWVLTATDDSDIGDLAAGDSVEIKVLGEDAGGADCTTDCRFRTVQIEYY